VIGLAAALVIFIVLARLGAGDRPSRVPTIDAAPESHGWGIVDRRGFASLASIGIVDNGTRTAFLTFLPFALMAKGLAVAGVGGALALVFAGGAIGKFVCGVIADRVGVIRTVIVTEAVTALGILTIVAAPLPVALAVLPALGVALNGTSSVLYATVADLVAPARRSRAYGLYYTLSIGASAIAPSVYGVVSDAFGVTATLTITGVLVLVTIPLCLALRPSVAAPARA
jgi:MFS family permease